VRATSKVTNPEPRACICIRIGLRSRIRRTDKGRAFAWLRHRRLDIFHVTTQSEELIADPLVGNEATAAIDACAAGLSFGMFLSCMVEPLVTQSKLRIMLPDIEPPPISISAVYPQAKLMSARVRVFVDWMTQELRQTIPDCLTKAGQVGNQRDLLTFDFVLNLVC